MKREYESLVVSGFKDCNLDDIKDLCVNSFNSNRREMIFEKFKKYVTLLSKINVNLEIWIDGSFVTKKQDPDDIDVLILADNNEINNLDLDSIEYLKTLLYQPIIKNKYFTDVYFCDKNNEKNRSYWRGWFLFTRNEEPKGIIRLRVNYDR